MTFTVSLMTNFAARQTFATLTVSLSMLMFGFSLGWISATLEKFLSEEAPVDLTHEELSWVMALPNLGAILSPLPVSLLMDRIGRRNSLLVLYTLPITGWVMVYYATDVWSLGFARFILGLWLGVAVTITPVYIGEVSDPKHRSFFNSFTPTMMFSGSAIVFCVGMMVEYSTLAVLGFILSVSFCICLLLVPESPYYYLLNGKKNEAMDSLMWLFKECDAQDRFNKMDKFMEAELKTQVKMRDLIVNAGYFKSLVTVIVLTLLIRGAGSSLVSLLPILLPKRAFLSFSNNDAYIINIFTSLIFSFRQKWIIKLGIRKLLITSCLISGTMMAIVAVWESLKDTNEFIANDLYWVPFVSFIIFTIVKCSGAGPIVMALKGEMFPTEFKSILAALTTISGNLAAFIVYKLYLIIHDTFGNQYNFVIAYTCSFGIALFTYYYVIETEGKSLEEIQSDLQKSTKSNCNLDCNKNNP